MAIAPAVSAGPGFTPEQERVISKVLWRIVPFLLICYIIAYLDRVNVGVAGLTMNHDLGLSPSEFGWSAGLFFFGYFLAEVPSNLALQAVGARKWIARILITWGLLSTGTAFVVGPVSFGVMRFLLGLGEAGFTPGVFLYVLVSCPGERPRHSRVPARHPDRQHRRRAALEFPARPGGPCRAARMAVAADAGRPARDDPRLRVPVHADGQA
jgi:hypothetical protein